MNVCSVTKLNVGRVVTCSVCRALHIVHNTVLTVYYIGLENAAL